MSSSQRSSRPQKVALILPNLGGGGAERVAVTSANDLAARGHHVNVVLIGGGGVLKELLSERVAVTELRAGRTIAAVPALVRYFRERKPDAVHILMWPNTVVALLAHWLARSKARVVVSDHTHISQHFRFLNDAKQFRSYRRTTRLLYRRADVRICVSAAAAEDLAQITGLRRSEFEVVHSPIGPPATVRHHADADAIWGNKAKRIVAVGSLIPVKNHALLIRAFARLRDREAQLIILGEGPLRSQLEVLAQELDVADRIAMPGFTKDPWPYLASAQVFVLCSEYEGSPVSMAEALYMGLNVVSTDCVSGPAELLDHGAFGDLVPCGNEEALAVAIARALSRPKDLAKARERALELAGPGSVARYSDLLLGQEEQRLPS